MRDCPCPIPEADPNPRHSGTCVRCGFRINPEWTANDRNFDAFFDHLASTFGKRPPPAFDRFRELCAARERWGRVAFGFAYLDRDNIGEAAEEAADLVIYPLLDVLAHRRQYHSDEDIDLALTAALKAYEAYEALTRLKGKRHGSP